MQDGRAIGAAMHTHVPPAIGASWHIRDPARRPAAIAALGHSPPSALVRVDGDVTPSAGAWPRRRPWRLALRRRLGDKTDQHGVRAPAIFGRPPHAQDMIDTHVRLSGGTIVATLADVAERATPVRPDPKREGPRAVRLRVAKPRDGRSADTRASTSRRLTSNVHSRGRYSRWSPSAFARKNLGLAHTMMAFRLDESLPTARTHA